MKAKNILCILTAVVGIISLAAGVAVIVGKLIGTNDNGYNYIECECDPDEE